MKSEKDFPNGFDAWQETHFNVAVMLSQKNGTHTLTMTERYTIAWDLTDEFEKQNKIDRLFIHDEQYLKRLNNFFIKNLKS